MRRSKRSEEAKRGSRSPSPIPSMLAEYGESESAASSVKSKRKNELDFRWTRVLSLSYRNLDPTVNYSIIKDKENCAEASESEQGSGNNIEWAIFQPDRFASQNKNLKLVNYQIN